MMLFIIGFGLAYFFNVNTITIAKTLSKDPKARGEMVQMAVAFKNAQKEQGDSVYISKAKSVVDSDIASANRVLGIGRGTKSKDSFFGIILTAVAISLGAPFWFDLLSKFVKLKNSVTAPQKNWVANNDPQTIKRVG